MDHFSLEELYQLRQEYWIILQEIQEKYEKAKENYKNVCNLIYDKEQLI